MQKILLKFTGKLIALNTYIRKVERSKIDNLSFHLREHEKEQIKYKVSQKKREGGK